MRRTATLLLLYVLAVSCANPLAAKTPVLSYDHLVSIRDAGLRKLKIHDPPQELASTVFRNSDGQEITLDDFDDKFIVLNFWAIWCAPCRKELPSLNRLQQEFGSDRFEVIAVSTGRTDEARAQAFLDEAGVDVLPLYVDQKQELARDAGVLGIPTTLLIRPDREVIARVLGEIDWFGPEVKELFAPFAPD